MVMEMFDQKEYDRNRYITNKESRVLQVSDYQKDNPEKVNANFRKWYSELRAKVMELLGGNPPKCVRCGFSDVRCLQIDHINGGGSEQRRHLGSVAILNYVLKHPKEFQLLCANCQWKKRYENKEHGRRERERLLK